MFLLHKQSRPGEQDYIKLYHEGKVLPNSRFSLFLFVSCISVFLTVIETWYWDACDSWIDVGNGFRECLGNQRRWSDASTWRCLGSASLHSTRVTFPGCNGSSWPEQSSRFAVVKVGLPGVVAVSHSQSIQNAWFSYFQFWFIHRY